MTGKELFQNARHAITDLFLEESIKKDDMVGYLKFLRHGINEFLKVLQEEEDNHGQLTGKVKSSLAELFYDRSASMNEKTKTFEMIKIEIENYIVALLKDTSRNSK